MTNGNLGKERFILGLDLGTNSIGWAMVGLDDNDKPCSVIRTGVHVFPAGTQGTDEDFAQGRDESRAQRRRMKRLLRRQIYRRKARARDAYKHLAEYGLLPKLEGYKGQNRDKAIKRLDVELLDRYLTAHPELIDEYELRDRVTAQTLVYRLRKEALDRQLQPDELGRILYHLSQRRGFKSNRKAPMKEDEKPGEVKAAIESLADEIKSAGARTLGEYFAGLDPEQRAIRRRKTDRSMYEQEFELIKKAQAPHHQRLDEKFWGRMRRILFYQRPLKSTKGLVGRCPLEPPRRRAPMASPAYQEFRLLQKLNDLCWIEVETGDSFALVDHPELYETLYDALHKTDYLKFTEIAKLLKLKRNGKERTRFNLEAGGEKGLYGNRYASLMYQLFGENWQKEPSSCLSGIWQDLRSIQNETLLKRRAEEKWGLDASQIEILLQADIEEGYAAYSAKALQKLNQEMAQKIPFATALKSCYPEQAAEECVDLLPPYAEVGSDLRNPVVNRTLTELRKVVNAIVRRYGKPEKIRLEIVRDIKLGRKRRAEISKKMRTRQSEREDAKEQLRQWGVPVTRDAIERELLRRECNGVCPYTGREISPSQLFGESPQFDIEHIIPYSRSLDNSFANKTLCWHATNRNRKRGKTPYEVFSQDGDWEVILRRVAAFKGGYRDEKLRRFKLADLSEFDDFERRQLTDTAYAARLARDYLGVLYGAESLRRIQVLPGRLTSLLRGAWQLNRILGDPERNTKSRADHRHHAIDALVAAVTDRAVVQKICTRAKQLEELKQARLLPEIDPPWAGLLNDTREALARTIPSSRVDRKANGQLHEETIYGRILFNGEEKTVLRRPLEALSSKEIDNIVDECIKDRVVQALEASGEKNPNKAFANPANLPRMVVRDRNGRSREVFIRRVRVFRSDNPVPVGRDRRLVKTGGNHHMELYEVRKKGERRMVGVIVTTLVAAQRKAARRSVYNCRLIPNGSYMFSIHKGDVLRLEHPRKGEVLVTIRKISRLPGGNYVEGTEIKDARLDKDIKPKSIENGWFKLSDKQLGEMQARVVRITPLGEELDRV